MSLKTYKLEEWDELDNETLGFSRVYLLGGVHQQIYHAGTYIACVDSDLGATTATMVNSTDGITWAVATSVTVSNDMIDGSSALRLYSDDWVYYCVYAYTGVTYTFTFFKSDDGFSTATTINTITWAGGPIYNLFDIVYIDSKWWALVREDHLDGDYYIGFLDLTTPDTNFEASTVYPDSSCKATPMFEYNSKAYWLEFDYDASVYLKSWDGTSITTEKTWTWADFGMVAGDALDYTSYLEKKGNQIIFYYSEHGTSLRIHKFNIFDLEEEVYSSLYLQNGYVVYNIDHSGDRSVKEIFLQNASLLSAFVIKNNGKIIRRFFELDFPDDIYLSIGIYLWTDVGRYHKTLLAKKPNDMTYGAMVYEDFDPENTRFANYQYKGNRMTFIIKNDDFSFERGQYVKIYETDVDVDEDSFTDQTEDDQPVDWTVQDVEL